MSDRDFRRARELLWELVTACGERIRHCPHATVALARERDYYASEAIGLTASDVRHIDRINSELPRRLSVLRGAAPT